MWRHLAPYLALAAIVCAAGAVAFGDGAPVWTAYVTLVLTLLVVLPGVERWERRRER